MKEIYDRYATGFRGRHGSTRPRSVVGGDIFSGPTRIAHHEKRARFAVVMDPAHYAGLFRPGSGALRRSPPQWDPAYRGFGEVEIRDLATFAALAEDGRGPMTTPHLDRLRAACQRLRLYQVETDLPTLLEQPAKREVSYADFLDEVLTREVGVKTQKHLAMRVAMARFPFRKTLEGFDSKFQPSIDVKLVRELATGRYIEGGDNVLLLGPPGGSRGQGLKMLALCRTRGILRTEAPGLPNGKNCE